MRYFCNGLLENLSYRLSELEQLPKYAKQPSPSFVPALYPVCLCLFFLLNPPKRFLTKFAAVKSAMLTFVTLALRIHPFAATPFCLHRSLQICLHSGSARSFSTTIPLQRCLHCGFAPNEFRFNASDAVHEQRLRQGRTAFCLRSRFHGLQLQACAVNSCCFTLFSGGALRQDFQQAERSCLLCAVRRSGIYRAWLYRIHSGRCAAEQQRNSACAAVRQHFIFRCRTFAHAISRTRSRMIPMNKFSVLCRYRLTRFIRQKFQYFSITANKHSRCISRAGMKRKEQI